MANPTGRNGIAWRDAEIARLAKERDALRARVRELEAHKAAAQFVVTTPAMVWKHVTRGRADEVFRLLITAGIPGRIEENEQSFAVHTEAVVWSPMEWAAAADVATRILASGSLLTVRIKEKDE